MSEENQNNVEAIPFPTQEAQAQEGTVELNDLNANTLSVSPALIINALKCIDAGANRGAYQGGELSSVGSVRDQLYTLVAPIVEEMAKKEKAKAEAAKAE